MDDSDEEDRRSTRMKERMRERQQGETSDKTTAEQTADSDSTRASSTSQDESINGEKEAEAIDPADTTQNQGSSESPESSESSEPSEPSEPSETSKPSGTNNSAVRFATPEQLENVTIDPVGNVKEGWNGNYVYLPDVLDDPLEDNFDRLRLLCKRELDWKPTKNKHYYPVVFLEGLPAIMEMSPVEFHDRVEELGLLEEAS